MLSRKSFGLLLVLALSWTGSALAQDFVDAGAPPPPPDAGPAPEMTGQCVALWGPCDLNHPSCQRGQCTPQGCMEISPNECRDSQECMTGTIALCAAIAGQCTDVGQCPEQFECNANVCSMVIGQPHPGNNDDGGPNPGQCPADNPDCINSGTMSHCIGDAECGPNGRCINQVCSVGGPGSACVGDAECGPNSQCITGQCRLRPGNPCMDSGMCVPDNQCINGLCTPTNTQCPNGICNNTQCPNGNCNNQCPNGICNNNQCPNGNCNNQCPNGNCNTNSQCPNGNCGPSGYNSGSMNGDNKGPQISCSVTPGSQQSAWSGLGFLVALSMLIARRARRS